MTPRPPVSSLLAAAICGLIIAGPAAVVRGQEPSPGAADIGQLRDITGIEQLPPLPPAPAWPYWLGAGVFGLAVIGVVGWKWWRRPPPPARPLAPADWARRELDRIESLALPNAGDSDRYSTLVAQVVRNYLQLRFGLHAPRQSTVEFLRAVRDDARLPPDARELLRGLLERCDLAKFARAAPSPEECAGLLTAARRFVEQTAAPGPAEAAKPPADANGRRARLLL